MTPIENGSIARIRVLEDWRDTVENDVKTIPVILEHQKTLKEELRGLRGVLTRIAWMIAVPAIAGTAKVIYDAASAAVQ